MFAERPYAEVLIDWLGKEAAGFAIFFHNYSTFLAKPGIYLEDLYVRPKFRGSGCGKALLVHLAGLAVARGCGRLEWSVLDWNQRAIAFYESLGAKALDEWTMYRVTGEALYRFAKDRAEAKGWRLNWEVKGHRVSDFPHAIYKAGALGDFDGVPVSGLWILEIQIAHPTRPIGAFYEDLLIRAG